MNKINRCPVTIGVDGSLYELHPHLRHRMRDTMRRLVNPRIEFDLVQSKDGSGTGAALAAAIAQELKKKPAEEEGAQNS